MPVRTFLSSLLVAMVLVAVPNATSAPSQCATAPGVGAGDQYCEAIPDGSGTRDTAAADSSGRAGSGTGTSKQGVSAATASRLEKSADGGAIVELSGGTQPSRKSSTSAARTRTPKPNAKSKTDNGNAPDPAAGVSAKAGGSADGGPDVPSNNPLRAVSSAVEGGPTAGGGLIWGMIGLAALIGGVGLRRRGFSPAAEAGDPDRQ